MCATLYIIISVGLYRQNLHFLCFKPEIFSQIADQEKSVPVSNCIYVNQVVEFCEHGNEYFHLCHRAFLNEKVVIT